jgi:hypothetical protein
MEVYTLVPANGQGHLQCIQELDRGGLSITVVWDHDGLHIVGWRPAC